MKRVKKIFLFIIFIGLLFGCAKKEQGQVVERKFSADKMISKTEKINKTTTIDTSKKMVKTQDENTQKSVKNQQNIPTKKYKTYLSSVESEGDIYTIVLDDHIEITNIKKDGDRFIFPYSESNGRKYYFIWFEDKGLLAKLKNDILNNQTKNKKYKPQVTNIQIKEIDKGTLKGFASITFDDEFTIKSIPIFIGGKYGDSIGMPSVKINGKRVHRVKFIDKNFKKEIEKLILNQYYKK